jgi:hypothetical protein
MQVRRQTVPLRDHFHLPWSDENLWEGFHSAWANTIVRHLNESLLPAQFRAVPQIHLGASVETAVATFERLSGNGTASAEPGSSALATALWAPPDPGQSLTIDFLDQDVCEVRVYDTERGMRLVGAIEFISPGNKDRSETRQAFVAKCAAYLQEQIGLIIVDIVTARRANLHQELLQLVAPGQTPVPISHLYAVAYRPGPNGRPSRLDTWPASLTVGQPLPTLPLWLASELPIPIDLEMSYEETCRVLRIR